MFINKTKDGYNNICGKNISRLRIEMKISQRALADKMQLVGIDIDKMQSSGLSAEKDLLPT